MSLSTRTPLRTEVVYPESDGEPIAENTLQYEWIVTIKGGLDALFRDAPNIFIAGDLFWYPVEGDPTIRLAPDVMVVFGRPKGHRSSYRQWEEEGLAPQVVFEVLSPGNRFGEMLGKLRFYERHGVDEYYLFDPDRVYLDGWLREGSILRELPQPDGWTSPRLGVRFDLASGDLVISGPDGRRFESYVELARQRDEAARQRDEVARQRDEVARQRDEAQRQSEVSRNRAESLEAQLRKLGADPQG